MENRMIELAVEEALARKEAGRCETNSNLSFFGIIPLAAYVGGSMLPESITPHQSGGGDYVGLAVVAILFLVAAGFNLRRISRIEYEKSRKKQEEFKEARSQFYDQQRR